MQSVPDSLFQTLMTWMDTSMTQSLSEKTSMTGMDNASLAVLSPQEIEVFNNAREIKSLIAWVHSEYQKSKSARSRFERQWALNMAMYLGKQNMGYFQGKPGESGAGMLRTPPVLPHVSRRVFNRIRPVVRTELARLTSNKPNASVVPASSEDADLFAAQAAEDVWQSHYTQKKLHATFSRSMFWATICGTAFTKCYFDPDAYDCVTKETGSIESGVVTPYHLFVPDLYEQDLEAQPFIFNAYTKSAQWVEQTYGVKVNATIVQAESPFQTAMFVLGKNEAAPDSVLCIEAWLKPGAHKMFPEGAYMVLIDQQVVCMFDYQDEGPLYEHKMYPFIKWDHIPTGMFYSDSVITDLIDIQRDYNRTRNQIIEAKNRTAKPQLIAPKGSIDPRMVTSAPGQVIFYRPGLNPPQPLPIQPVPAYVMQELDLNIRDMEDISSQHQVSRGETPSGVTAATAINFMQERDDSLLTPAYQSVEQGWEKWARLTVSYAVQFWSVKKTVSVTGVDGSFDSIALKGSELSTGTDVRMEAGSALPVSKSAKQAFILDLMKMGALPPEKGLSLLDMGGMDQLYNEMQIDERAAQRENLRMARLDINDIMQHEQNARTSNEFAKMQEEMALAQAGPQDPMQQGMSDIPPAGGPAVPPIDGMPMQMQGAGGPMGGGGAPEMMGGPESMGMGMPGMAPPGIEVAPPPGPMGMDPNTEAPLQIPMNLVPVNTWDNHQLHIDIHNRYRKSQAFELLPAENKQQFEYHVAQHAMALNSAANAAMMTPPPPEGGDITGAENGSGTPVGSNQFGPPGTSDGGAAPPPDQMQEQGAM